MDFSLDAWNDLTGIPPNRVTISWDFTPCTTMIDTTQSAKLATKEGSNNWWFAFQVSNTLNPIATIKVLNKNSWINLDRQSYGFFQGSFGAGLTMPIVVEATDSTGKIYSKTLSSIAADTVVDF